MCSTTVGSPRNVLENPCARFRRYVHSSQKQAPVKSNISSLPRLPNSPLPTRTRGIPPAPTQTSPGVPPLPLAATSAPSHRHAWSPSTRPHKRRPSSRFRVVGTTPRHQIPHPLQALRHPTGSTRHRRRRRAQRDRRTFLLWRCYLCRTGWLFLRMRGG